MQSPGTRQANHESQLGRAERERERIDWKLNREAYREPSRSDIEAMEDCARGHNEDR